MTKRKGSPRNRPSHFPKSKKEESEYGPGKKDILVCKRCKAAYWYKSWHHNLDDYPELDVDKNIKFTLCSACKMIKQNKFEGEIKVFSVSSKIREDVINTIQNVGETAYNKNCQNRLISLKKKEGGKKLVGHTTENQLAVRIGKKIAQSFNGDVEINHSKKESVSRVKVDFGKK